MVIEDRGIFAFLFLNNNFHVVHHMHPRVAWYKLPAQYVANRAHYLRRNDGYRYASYWQVIRAYLLRPKDPVPHPLWTQIKPSALSQTPLQPVDVIRNPLPMAPQPLVKPERILAGPIINTAPTITIKITVNPRINCLVPLPRYIPTISVILNPLCLIDNMPEK